VPLKTTPQHTLEARQRLRAARSYACYYGAGGLEALSGFDAAILAADAHSPAELEWLNAAGTVTLGYLSLGEDASTDAGPWVRRDPDGEPLRDPDWGSFVVDPSHPAWKARILGAASDLLECGFAGLFLDTLDTERPDDQGALEQLVLDLRQTLPAAPLVMNRGFGILPRLAEAVDGVVFESLSCTWQLDPDGGVHYRRVEAAVFEDNREIAEQIASLTKPVGTTCLALDYADTPELESHARSVASDLGFVPFVSNRLLTRLG
jgi:polysaccharide biosynthesis protein PelA